MDERERHDGAATQASCDLFMYCTPWCPDCGAAREWLDSRSVEYVEVDVSRDLDARAYAADLNDGRLHTPTFRHGESVCVDFKPEWLRERLGCE